MCLTLIRSKGELIIKEITYMIDIVSLISIGTKMKKMKICHSIQFILIHIQSHQKQEKK